MKKIHSPKILKETYRAVAWLVRLYPRLVLERNAILNASPAPPEVPSRTNSVSDPTGQKAAQLEKLTTQILAIEAARDRLPAEYRQGVWNNCVLHSPYPDYADVKTWQAYKNDFIFSIAVELGYPII